MQNSFSNHLSEPAAQMEQHSIIINVDEAAQLLRVPRSVIYKLAQEGKIPAQKVGRHWRFHRATLEKWVTGQIKLEVKEDNP